jgi:hypothetical protein
MIGYPDTIANLRKAMKLGYCERHSAKPVGSIK